MEVVQVLGYLSDGGSYFTERPFCCNAVGLRGLADELSSHCIHRKPPQLPRRPAIEFEQESRGVEVTEDAAEGAPRRRPHHCRH